MTTVMGRCERCDESAVVMYNDHRYCQWHYEAALQETRRHLDALRRTLSANLTHTEPR
jgi:hypothetical protein